VLFDSREKIGAKILVSGGTRCNVTNRQVTASDYNGGVKHFIRHVFEAFTPAKIMYGSDWPVCLLAGNYEQVYGIIRKYTESLSKGEGERVMGLNAAEFYGLELPG